MSGRLLGTSSSGLKDWLGGTLHSFIGLEIEEDEGHEGRTTLMNRLARKESEGRGRQALRGHITTLSRPGPRHMTLEGEWVSRSGLKLGRCPTNIPRQRRMRPGIVEEAESGTMSASLVTTISRQRDTDLVASSAWFLPFGFCCFGISWLWRFE